VYRGGGTHVVLKTAVDDDRPVHRTEIEEHKKHLELQEAVATLENRFLPIIVLLHLYNFLVEDRACRLHIGIV